MGLVPKSLACPEPVVHSWNVGQRALPFRGTEWVGSQVYTGTG